MVHGRCAPACHISPYPRCRDRHHLGYRHCEKSHRQLPLHACPSGTQQDEECPGCWRRNEGEEGGGGGVRKGEREGGGGEEGEEGEVE